MEDGELFDFDLTPVCGAHPGGAHREREEEDKTLELEAVHDA